MLVEEKLAAQIGLPVEITNVGAETDLPLAEELPEDLPLGEELSEDPPLVGSYDYVWDAATGISAIKWFDSIWYLPTWVRSLLVL